MNEHYFFPPASAYPLNWCLFLLKSDPGFCARYAADRETALLQGIRVNRLSILMFGLSAALAALGGLLVVPIIPASPELGFTLLLSSFAAVVLGGFDNVGGTVVAALVVAITQQLLTGYVNHDYSEAYPYIILLVVLILRPSGLIKQSTSVRY